MRPARSKAVAVGGVASILMGAVLLFAPPSVGAEGNDDINLYGVVFDGPSSYDADDDETSFTYRFTGPAGESISHVVVGAFCVTPSGYDAEDFEEFDGSTDLTGLKINNPAVGSTLTFVFDGALGTDPAGSTWWLKKSEVKGPIVLPGPSCEEPPPPPSITVEKVVVGTAPQGAAYAIDVELDEDPTLVADDAAIAPNAPYSRDGAGSYDLTESVTGGADSVAWACFLPEANEPFATSATASIENVVVDESDVRCVVTNTYDDPEEPSLTVQKVVVGTAPQGAAYAIDVELDEDPTLVADDAAIAPNAPYSRDGAGSYDLTESVTGGADSVAWACFLPEANEPFATSATASIENVVVDESDVRCVVTNRFTPTITTPPPPPTTTPPAEDASLTIVKAVTGDIPDEWSADFEGTEPSLGTFTLSGTDAVITDEITFDDLEAGTYSVVETDSGLASLTGIVCDEGVDPTLDLDSGSLSIALDEGDDVTCTFTNDFPEVGGEVVTPPVEPTPATPPAPPAPVAEPTEVKGETVTRTLPRTGSSTGGLATAGIALMIFGGILVGGSRRLQMS